MRISKKALSLAMLDAHVDTFKELAAITGLSCNTLSRLNNGAAPMPSTLRKIAGVLNVEPASLLDEKEA